MPQYSISFEFGIAASPGDSLDLVVTVYNINKGRNLELLGRSEHLAGYAEFVAQVREHEKQG